MADDCGELEGPMGRFLRPVSFESGERPAYGELRGLFIDGAKLITNGAGGAEIATVEEFIARGNKARTPGELTEFREVELAEITEIFGNVPHRFSTYEKRGVTGGRPIDTRAAGSRPSSSARRRAGG